MSGNGSPVESTSTNNDANRSSSVSGGGGGSGNSSCATATTAGAASAAVAEEAQATPSGGRNGASDPPPNGDDVTMADPGTAQDTCARAAADVDRDLVVGDGGGGDGDDDDGEEEDREVGDDGNGNKANAAGAAADNDNGAGHALDLDATASSSSRQDKKPRKKYVITKSRENWTAVEHQLFLDALRKYGRSWKQIENQVRTKNVIQIRSHAQKYFIKVQKHNTGEVVPPPRPKRRASTPTPVLASPLLLQPHLPANTLVAAHMLAANPQVAVAYAEFALRQQQLQQQHHQQQLQLHAQGLSLPSPALSQQQQQHSPMNQLQSALERSRPEHAHVQSASQQHTFHMDTAQHQFRQQHERQQLLHLRQQHLQQQMHLLQQEHCQQQHEQQLHHQQFAAAIQNHPHLLPFGPLSSPSGLFFPPLPQQPIPAANRTKSGASKRHGLRPNVAKTITPRTVDPSAAAVAGFASPSVVPQPPVPATCPVSLVPASATYSHSSIPGNKTQRFTQELARSLGQAGRSQSASALGSGSSNASTVPTPDQSGSLADLAPASQTPPTKLDYFPPPTTGPVEVAAAAAAAVAAAGGGDVMLKPNFTRIYGFFATLFNPEDTIDANQVVGTVESSTLDSEIIKLLVRNLELNLGNDNFRSELTETYRNQQTLQEHQNMGIVNQTDFEQSQMGLSYLISGDRADDGPDYRAQVEDGESMKVEMTVVDTPACHER